LSPASGGGGGRRPDRAEVVRIVEDMAGTLADTEGLTLVDVEYVRVFLDKAGGVTLTDCEHFSRLLSQRLDEADPIPDAYYLEVSSPGLDRPLKKERDYVIFQGRRVVVKTYAPIEGQRAFSGALLGLEEGRVRIRCDDGRVQEIPLDLVARARLDEDVWGRGSSG
jgi:ribosome maturation factor RimP